MTLLTPNRPTRIAAAVAAALGTAVAQADTPPPDTSGWKCEQCPFFQGYAADADVGAEYADGANASFGRYSGIDHSGGYLDAAASGQWHQSGGVYAKYDLERLGLPSRDGFIEAGQDGRFEARLGYDGQPTRLYDTGATPFQSGGAGQLILPSGWVPSSSTGGMSQLTQNLVPAKLEYDRRTVSLLGQYFLGSQWTLFADFNRQEKEGTSLIGGSFLTDAAQLPQPIDYVTHSVEAGASWSGSRASLKVVYSGSWFKEGTDSLSWANPYLPIMAGATEGRLALPPGNNLQQVAASGEVQLPVFATTTLTYAASIGRVKQDAAFLPISTLAGAPTLTQGSLNGDVHLSHFALSLASRPMTRMYVRGTATYDGRDDHTAPLAIAYTVTDVLPGGTFITPRYGEDRTRLTGSADYRLLRWIRVGVGGDYVNVHYAPGQVVSTTENSRSWAQLTVSPINSVTLTVKGGNARRRASSFDTVALPLTENPLLRAYNYAPRDQNFFNLEGSWTVTSQLTWALQGNWADDAYRLSQLGLKEGRDRHLSSTLTWTPIEKLDFYLDGGYQRVAALQSGVIGASAPVWTARDGQYFWNSGAGAHWAARPRWDLGLDYTHATTRGNTTVLAGGQLNAFPQNRTRLDSLWFNATYRWTDALKVRLRYGHEKYDTSDWALASLTPDTVPNFLALGVQPYRHFVNVYGLTVSYQIGTRNSANQEPQ
jgi:MtrB/PioB family decaheme-associated outer membrane protein